MGRDGRAVLITDLDNTLYDFAAYYEAGLAALVDELCILLSMDRAHATARLRDVFTQHDSIEYPFAVEELPEVLTLEHGRRAQVIRQCLAAFWAAASERIEPYPTVRRTLQHLRSDGVAVIAHTDAPIHEAMRRLRHMDLDRYFTGIIAQQWFRRRPGRSQVVCLSDVPGWSRPPRRLDPLWRVPVADRKPNSFVYRRIADDLGIDPRRSTVIGDSIARDLLPALEVGFTAVWAQYGRRAVVTDLMKSVVPRVLPEVGSVSSALDPGIRKVDVFEDVLDHLPITQLRLALPGGRL